MIKSKDSKYFIYDRKTMSRIIVKNLPSSLTLEKFKKDLSLYGTLTDVKLVYTKSGKFRQFAFVGFLHDAEAEKAIHGLNKCMLQNQQVVAELCRDFGLSSSHVTKSASLNTQKIEKTLDVEKDVGEKYSPTVVVETETVNKDKQFLKSKIAKTKTEKSENNKFHHAVKMRGCPFSVTKQQITDFVFPLKPRVISVQKSKNGIRNGFVIVDFKCSEDAAQALKLHGGYIKNRYIELCAYTEKPVGNFYEDKSVWQNKVSQGHTECNVEDIMENGRLFVRNLSYACTEQDLETLFEKFGPLSDVSMQIDNLTKACVGYAFITYMLPEHALNAFNELDGSVFQGRMLHVLPSKPKKEDETPDHNSSFQSSFKKEKDLALAKASNSSHNWNTLFIGTNAVAEAIAEKYNADKTVILESSDKHSAAVHIALGETQLVQQTKQFLTDNGINLEAFSTKDFKRSKTVIIVKNLTVGATCTELRYLFEQHTELGKVLLAPAGVTAIVECLDSSGAKRAFTKLAYRKFHRKPLYLEWAPEDVFVKVTSATIDPEVQTKDENDVTAGDVSGVTLFVKNLNFSTSEEDLKAHFETCGRVVSCKISKKKTHKTEELLSMGYGFVQFEKQTDAKNALKNLQSSLLDDHALELKASHRKLHNNENVNHKRVASDKEPSSKILVRNIPFQANKKELFSLFKSFGELKTVRLPQKTSGMGSSGHAHRGFAFVDFLTEQDAKKAFDALSESTHLYGRRLVLEWADTNKDSVDSLRRKTAENYHGNSKKRKELLDQAIHDAANDSE